MSEIFGSSIMGSVESASAIDSSDYDDALESVMEEYEEFKDDTVDSILGLATEECAGSDDCDCDEVDLSEDGDDIAEDDDDFYNTDDDLGIDDIEADEDAAEVDLSETSEFDDDEDDALEAITIEDDDKKVGTVNQMAITTIFAEDNKPNNSSVDDLIMDDEDLDLDANDDDDDISSDDADDLDLDDDEFGDDDITQESATFEDISKTFSSVLDSLED